mmetsp:Transcript_13086/g.25640  ORF Transcript_13086/g.25640 Transcript_13086/m.25640 type:complete len:236 (+) Transcript_13086:736-1443(+)
MKQLQTPYGRGIDFTFHILSLLCFDAIGYHLEQPIINAVPMLLDSGFDGVPGSGEDLKILFGLSSRRFFSRLFGSLFRRQSVLEVFLPDTYDLLRILQLYHEPLHLFIPSNVDVGTGVQVLRRLYDDPCLVVVLSSLPQSLYFHPVSCLGHPHVRDELVERPFRNIFQQQVFLFLVNILVPIKCFHEPFLEVLVFHDLGHGFCGQHFLQLSFFHLFGRLSISIVHIHQFRIRVLY